MKKILLYMMLAMIGFIAGCKKDTDPIFDDPDTRLAAELSADQAKLLNAPNGWKAMIYPKGGKGFFYYFKFKADGSVTMLSDFNTTTARVPMDATYRLKALQRPTLIFDTYSYIHLPSDPNGDISGGTNGVALASDFEFAFVRSTADSLVFEGIFNKNVFKMVKLTAAEEQNILSGAISTFISESTPYITNKILYMILDGKQVPVSLSAGTKVFSISGKVSSVFYYGLDVLELGTPIKYGSYIFDKIYWDKTEKYFYALKGTERIKIEISPAPLVLDTDPALHTVLNTRWASLKINIADLPDLSTDFLSKYNAANANMNGYGSRYIEYITVLFGTNNQITLAARCRNPASPTSTYTANYVFNMTLNSTTGVATFVLDPAQALGAGLGNSNANSFKTYLKPLTDYFIANSFKIAYISAGAPSGSTVGAFLGVSNPNTFFYGVLGQ
jgi:Domain of unknown function (DUF4302)